MAENEMGGFINGREVSNDSQFKISDALGKIFVDSNRDYSDSYIRDNRDT